MKIICKSAKDKNTLVALGKCSNWSKAPQASSNAKANDIIVSFDITITQKPVAVPQKPVVKEEKKEHVPVAF